ncbi:hypothetical protein ACTFIT_006874 [Dictyostelium discoideum]
MFYLYPLWIKSVFFTWNIILDPLSMQKGDIKLQVIVSIPNIVKTIYIESGFNKYKHLLYHTGCYKIAFRWIIPMFQRRKSKKSFHSKIFNISRRRKKTISVGNQQQIETNQKSN